MNPFKEVSDVIEQNSGLKLNVSQIADLVWSFSMDPEAFRLFTKEVEARKEEHHAGMVEMYGD